MGEERKEEKHRDDEAIRVVLSSREGRHFVRMVLGFLEWNEDVFSSDPTLLAARVGRQSAGVTIYRVLNERQPELLARVLSEERERIEAQKQTERMRGRDGGRDADE